MSDQTITCPNCKTEIKLTESLAAPLLEATRKEFERKITQKEKTGQADLRHPAFRLASPQGTRRDRSGQTLEAQNAEFSMNYIDGCACRLLPHACRILPICYRPGKSER